MAESFLDQTATIEVKDPTFRAVVEEESLTRLPQLLDGAGLAKNRAFVLTDANVDNLYGDTMRGVLSAAGIEPIVFTMQAGEEHKTYQQAGDFVEQLSDAGANRNDPLIAFGGGVVGDLGGFVASIYNRGVPLVHVPTTLLAMVDSSIGGKTGVDHGGKNKTGSFYQPELVVTDPSVLRTLDPRVYTEGFGEIAKYAILDGDFLPELEAVANSLRKYSDAQLSALGAIVARCVKQKCDVIAADPFEKADRILLNYGHTLGHGLEAAGGYTELLHGEGVAIGMHFAAQFTAQLGYTDRAFIDRQKQLLEALGLPTGYTGSANVDEVLYHMGKDKKNTSNATKRFVLPRAPGDVFAKEIPVDVVSRAVESFLSQN